MCIYHILFIIIIFLDSSDRHLGCFHLFDTENNTAMNVDCYIHLLMGVLGVYSISLGVSMLGVPPGKK